MHLFTSSYSHLTSTFLRPECCFSGKKRSNCLRNFIIRKYFYYYCYCRLSLCFPLIDLIILNYLLSFQSHLMLWLLIIRRLYTASKGQVPNGRIIHQQCQLKSIELLSYTLSMWFKPCFFLFTLFFYIEVTSPVSFHLFFESPFFHWGHWRLRRNSIFSGGILESDVMLKFSSLWSAFWTTS